MARTLGFTDQQGQWLVELFGSHVPESAAILLQEAAVDVSPDYAFRSVLAALNLRPEPMASPTPSRETSRLERLDGFLRAILDSAIRDGQCLGYEIVEAVYGGQGRYTIKIGIDPWGVTFLDGSIGDLSGEVRKILNEIRRNRIVCPKCRLRQPLKSLVIGEWRCACDTRFYACSGMSSDDLLKGRSGGSAFVQTLAALGPSMRIKKALARIEAGVDVRTLFTDVRWFDTGNTRFYSVGPGATVRPDCELPWPVLIGEALEGMGFVPQHDDHNEVWFEGAFQGEPLVVYPGSPDFGCEWLVVAWPRGTEALCQESLLGDADGYNRRVDRLDKWSDWVLGQPEQGLWFVMDWVSPIGEAYPVTAVWSQGGHPPRHDSVFEARGWLMDVLPTAISACRQCLEAFSDVFE